MAKSLRSKIKKRYRNLRRGYINEIKTKPETEEINSKCQKALAGLQYRQKEYKNAFLHPEDPQALFPQYKHPPIIDLRSASIPGSGLEWSGAQRKKKNTQQFEIEKSQDEQMNEERIQQNNIKNTQGDMNQQKSKQGVKKRKKVSKLKKTFVF